MKLTYILLLLTITRSGGSSVYLPFLEPSDNANEFTGVLDQATEFVFPQPFYFNNISYSSTYISTHGLISFGESYASVYVPRSFPLGPSDPPVITPYWNDIDLRETGSVFYEAVTNLSIISDFITDSQGSPFMCTSAVVMKWSEVCPFNNRLCGNLTNTFQVVLATSQYTNTSYAIFTYKCGSLNWVYYNAGIGFSAGQDFYASHNLSLTSNVNDIACLNEPTSPWSNVVYKVSGVMSSGAEEDGNDESTTSPPQCKALAADCNPQSSVIQYNMCCDPHNLGEFIGMLDPDSNVLRRYVMCPEEIPDWC